ncbi:conserved hypothetical protein [Talaromyces stipitatus ATCC 10500]|uniref:Prion-inhibition and propagation HeLo domain-containing protein n=1 Tax=Talaromyces stipitatus (strain ATCC 10500 / CBS 375.48 / QM 6759 / NRRL 1006) TaxID=441959 RepID=B8MGG5_TALSN|nr:uncharacterized protein TSTA_013840 [Talaromyces stipitatus ATCC 10500]EED16285.1 conserved hypothetical protein [Talaromyces stipitatus ATCC 10500]
MTTSDLSQLWQSAIQDYETTTGKKLLLSAQPFTNMQDVMLGTEELSLKFKSFRDDKSKVSKMRTAFKNNMWLIQGIVNTVQSVGNAASAFPPAMPANLIFSAFGQVMQSFADVSADYDKIMGFFEFTHRFLDRMSIIDQKLPDMPQFQRCVSRVFSSILKICATAQKYTAEKRMKKWFDNLLNGTDGALTSATTELEEAINELSQAVGLTTLRTIQIIDETTQAMNGNIDFLVSNAHLIDERTRTIESNTDTIIDQNRGLASKQAEMTDMQRETLQEMAQQSRLLGNIVGYFGSIQMGEKFGRKSFQDSVLKLGVVRLRLTRWSQAVGLNKELDNVESLSSVKISEEDLPMVKELLGRIMESFDDAERTSSRIKKRNPSLSSGSVLDPAKELDDAAVALHERMDTIVKTRQGQEPEEETDLILYEEKNFTRLIEDISDSVDDLVNLFPAVQETQQKLCEEEVDEINNKAENALSLLKEAAEGQDNMLSKTVTKVIESSTTYNNSVVFQGTNSGFQIGNNRGKISNVRFH